MALLRFAGYGTAAMVMSCSVDGDGAASKTRELELVWDRRRIWTVEDGLSNSLECRHISARERCFILFKNLHQIAARSKMAEAAKNPVSQPEKIVIANKHGEKLVGLLHETGSKELVILCHGARSHKGDNIMTKLALALEKERISAFRFDFAGNGESEGTFQFGHYWREVDDLGSVVQHFSSANHTVSAILGHSKGGDEVLLYASKYGDVRTFVNVSGRYDLNGGLELRLGENFMERIKKEGYLDIKDKTGSFDCRVTEESLLDRMNTNMHESCLKIAKDCLVLTVHGSEDDVIPVGDALEFAKIIPNHKLHVIQEADHFYSDHQAELASIVLEFLKAAFREDKTTSN